MKTIKFLSFFIAFIITLAINGQNKDLNGQLIANDEVEGIHILNKTASKYTISNADGSFIISAKLQTHYLFLV